MLDLDGTIYQSLDLKERAWHATIANGRSIGIEVANIGPTPLKGRALARLVSPGHRRQDRLVIPAEAANSPGCPLRSVELRPSRNEPVVGTIQGQKLEQYDFTPQQYEALARLTATLCTIFPKIRCDYPRTQRGTC